MAIWQVVQYLYAQAGLPQTLTEHWFDTRSGMLGMSLTLNVILLYVAWYLLRLLLKKETEKMDILTKLNAESQQITKGMWENIVDSTKAMTELTTIIREWGQKL